MEDLTCKTLRHDVPTFLSDWWSQLLTIPIEQASGAAAFLCSDAWKALSVVRGKLAEMAYQKSINKWNNLSQQVRNQIMECPTTEEAIEASNKLALTSSDYLR